MEYFSLIIISLDTFVEKASCAADQDCVTANTLPSSFNPVPLFNIHAFRKGKLELIEVKLEQRMGNKKVDVKWVDSLPRQ